MKLTRNELIRAQNRQLAELGVKRANNAGWLRTAMQMEWSEDVVQRFREADTRKEKPDTTIPECREQFKRLLECLKAGEKISAQDHARQISALLGDA